MAHQREFSFPLKELTWSSLLLCFTCCRPQNVSECNSQESTDQKDSLENLISLMQCVFGLGELLEFSQLWMSLILSNKVSNASSRVLLITSQSDWDITGTRKILWEPHLGLLCMVTFSDQPDKIALKQRSNNWRKGFDKTRLVAVQW